MSSNDIFSQAPNRPRRSAPDGSGRGRTPLDRSLVGWTAAGPASACSRGANPIPRHSAAEPGRRAPSAPARDSYAPIRQDLARRSSPSARRKARKSPTQDSAATIDCFRQFFGGRIRQRPGPTPRSVEQRGLGSGVIVTTDGYILTNNHVVDSATISRSSSTDGRTLEGEARSAPIKPSDLAVAEDRRQRTCRRWRSAIPTTCRSATSCSRSAIRSASARPSRWASSARRAGPPARATAATRTSCRPMRRSTTATRAARW